MTGAACAVSNHYAARNEPRNPCQRPADPRRLLGCPRKRGRTVPDCGDTAVVCLFYLFDALDRSRLLLADRWTGPPASPTGLRRVDATASAPRWRCVPPDRPGLRRACASAAPPPVHPDGFAWLCPGPACAGPAVAGTRTTARAGGQGCGWG